MFIMIILIFFMMMISLSRDKLCYWKVWEYWQPGTYTTADKYDTILLKQLTCPKWNGDIWNSFGQIWLKSRFSNIICRQIICMENTFAWHEKYNLQTNNLHGSPDGRAQTLPLPGASNWIPIIGMGVCVYLFYGFKGILESSRVFRGHPYIT